MIRNLKALMLAAMAVAALGAVWASAAQAAPLFTAPGAGAAGQTTITSTPDSTGKKAHHVLDIRLGETSIPITITCNRVILHGEMTGESATALTLTALYPEGECTFLFGFAQISMNGCDYTVTAAETVTIDCPAGKEIKIEGGGVGCQIQIPPQGPLSKVTYKTIKPALHELTVETSIPNIHGVATGGCPAVGTFTEGEYTTGNTILTGTRGGSMVDLTWDA